MTFMIFKRVQQLMNQALAVHLLNKEDEIYARNQIIALLHLTDFEVTVGETNLEISEVGS